MYLESSGFNSVGSIPTLYHIRQMNRRRFGARGGVPAIEMRIIIDYQSIKILHYWWWALTAKLSSRNLNVSSRSSRVSLLRIQSLNNFACISRFSKILKDSIKFEDESVLLWNSILYIVGNSSFQWFWAIPCCNRKCSGGFEYSWNLLETRSL